MGGADGLAAWRQLVDDAHVEIAIKCHGEGTGDGGGCHHQHVRGILALGPEFGALGHTEAVLFIDDDKAQTGELDGVLDDGMGAHEDLDGAVCETVEHLLAPFALDDACEQGHADVHVLEKGHDGLQVLFGKDLGRCHDAGLIAVVDGDEHRHEGYECLTTTHVAL